MALRNLWEEERTGLWGLGIGRRKQERCQGQLPSSRMGHLLDGSVFPEVGTLRRDHLSGMKSSVWDALGLRGYEISRSGGFW